MIAACRPACAAAMAALALLAACGRTELDRYRAADAGGDGPEPARDADQSPPPDAGRPEVQGILCPDGLGACTTDLICETPLDTANDCGACGRPACDLANIRANCEPGGPACMGLVCRPGYGNCARAVPDCETAYAPSSVGPGCFPSYLGTAALPIGFAQVVAAVAADGSTFVAGLFSGTVDFDPGPGADVRTAGAATPFVVKLQADGGYAWTRVFAGAASASIITLVAAAGLGVFAVGTFS